MRGQSFLLKALVEELGPVSDGPREEARKDKVKLGRVIPDVFKIVNKKGDIGWDAGIHVSIVLSIL